MRLNVANEKEDIIDAMYESGRLYYNTTFQLFERHTTAVLISPQDFLRAHRDHLEEKITDAIDFQGVIVDYEVLNAIAYCRYYDENKKQIDWTADKYTVALYLYLADLVSIQKPAQRADFIKSCTEFGLTLNPDDNLDYDKVHLKLIETLKTSKLDSKTFADAAKEVGLTVKIPANVSEDELNRRLSRSLELLDLYQTTFLKACREERMSLDAGEKFESPQLKEKFINTLKRLKLYDNSEIKELVEDLYNKGSFKVCGVEHSPIAPSENAHYLKIVEQLQNQDENKYVQLNKAISFSLGRRKELERIGETSSPQEAVQKAFEAAGRVANNKPLRDKAIKNGHELRRQRMYSQIWPSHPSDVEYMSEESANFMKDMLKGLPIETLRIMQATRQEIAYTTEPNLSKMYPKGDEKGRLPGLTEKACNLTRFCSKGANLSRYRIIMICKGNINYFSPDIEMMFNRQVLCHESVHTAFALINLEKFPDLLKETLDFKQKAEDVFTRLQSLNSPILSQDSGLDIIDPQSRVIKRSIKEVFNPQTKLDDYSKLDRQEEMLANMFSLANSLFAKDRMPQNNPFFEDPQNPVPELAELRNIYQEMCHMMDKISNRMMDKDRDIDILRNQQQQQQR